jgi:SAM-dependent methyltransferase
MTQKASDWLSNVDFAYHEKQFSEPYRSTVAFCDWLEKTGFLSPDSRSNVVDLGCGQGANIAYMGKRFPRSNFVGIDLNPQLVRIGNKILEEMNRGNCRLEVGDLFQMDPDYVSRFEGIVSFQTVSWLPDFLEPITAMAKMKSRWISLSSLFYEGPLSCTTLIKDYDSDGKVIKESYYNVYSLPLLRKAFARLGFSRFHSIPYDIDIDIPPPPGKGRGTFTAKLETGKRLQISGPLLMPWYFVAVEGEESSR